MSHVLVTYPVTPAERETLEATLTNESLRFVRSPSPGDLDDVSVVFGNAPVEQLEAAKDLRWLHSPSVGLDAYESLRLSRPDIRVSNSRLVMNHAVSEHGIALLLALTRHVAFLVRAQTDRRWARDDFAAMGSGTLLFGKTVGVLGYGSIAQTLIEKLHGLGMHIWVFRRGAEGTDVRVERFLAMSALHEYASELDVLLGLLPLTTDTTGLVDERVLNAMRPDAYVVNLGRGPVIAETALAAALGTGRLAGAGLDVFEDEPLPPSSPLWAMENVIISPHIAGRFDNEGALHIEQFTSALERWRTSARGDS